MQLLEYSFWDQSNYPLSYGWICTQDVVEIMKDLVLLDLNLVPAMEGALTRVPPVFP